MYFLLNNMTKPNTQLAKHVALCEKYVTWTEENFYRQATE